MKYKNYQSEDFLSDDGFVQWVLTGKKNVFWENFAEQYPDRAGELAQAKKLVLALAEADRQDVTALRPKLVWSRIRSEINHQSEMQEAAMRPMYRGWPFLAAATVILALGIGWALLLMPVSNKVSYQDLTTMIKEKTVLIEKNNQNAHPINVILEDGSMIRLSQGARLSYPRHFDKNERKVVLTGEAFFEVAKDPARPFYIYSNEVITKVLVTSFTINSADDSQQVVVRVRTGRVSVYSREKKTLAASETGGVVLLPNQQAIYYRENQLLSRKLVENPVPVVSSPATAQYDDAPVANVFRDIENKYGIHLIYSEEILKNCFITTTIGNESLYDTMELVCRIIGASYKEVDAQLVIASKGCQ